MINNSIRYSVILALTLLCSVAVVSGQETELVKKKLSFPAGNAPNSARVVVKEMGDAQGIISALDGAKKSDVIYGYRVRIFFDNSQNARELANITYSQFKESFPGISANVEYENPYFKVTVGNCLTNEEAIILWGNVKQRFDKAFVIRERISLNSIKEEVINEVEKAEL